MPFIGETADNHLTLGTVPVRKGRHEMGPTVENPQNAYCRLQDLASHGDRTSYPLSQIREATRPHPLRSPRVVSHRFVSSFLQVPA
jgi:hypothetical protein